MNFIEFGLELHNISGSFSSKNVIIKQQMRIDSLERAIDKRKTSN